MFQPMKPSIGWLHGLFFCLPDKPLPRQESLPMGFFYFPIDNLRVM